MATLDFSAADNAILRRVRVARALGVGLLSTLSLTVANAGDTRLVGVVQGVAWFAWAALVVAFLATGGGWLQSAAVRALMNDETTMRHRQRALVTGFWVFLMCSVMAYAATLYQPFPASLALRIVATAAISAVALRFAMLERRALKHD
jgi:hypothetical protein